jgi:hypothetical protein
MVPIVNTHSRLLPKRLPPVLSMHSHVHILLPTVNTHSRLLPTVNTHSRLLPTINTHSRLLPKRLPPVLSMHSHVYILLNTINTHSRLLPPLHLFILLKHELTLYMICRLKGEDSYCNPLKSFCWFHRLFWVQGPFISHIYMNFEQTLEHWAIPQWEVSYANQYVVTAQATQESPCLHDFHLGGGGRGYSAIILDIGATWRWVASFTRRPHYLGGNAAVGRVSELRTTLLARWFFQPWWWRQYVPPKHRF